MFHITKNLSFRCLVDFVQRRMHLFLFPYHFFWFAWSVRCHWIFRFLDYLLICLKLSAWWCNLAWNASHVETLRLCESFQLLLWNKWTILQSLLPKISYESCFSYTSPHQCALETSSWVYCERFLLGVWEVRVISASVSAIIFSVACVCKKSWQLVNMKSTLWPSSQAVSWPEPYAIRPALILILRMLTSSWQSWKVKFLHLHMSRWFQEPTWNCVKTQ